MFSLQINAIIGLIGFSQRYNSASQLCMLQLRPPRLGALCFFVHFVMHPMPVACALTLHPLILTGMLILVLRLLNTPLGRGCIGCE